jgi:anaerobic magnesium-protoporphyrin IX monomethyl ester cyclase
MSKIDFLLVSQSNVVDYEGFGDLPVDRLDIYKSLVYPRMIHHKGKFRSHLDYLNDKFHGKFYADADYPERRKMYNIWNMASMAGVHLGNYLSQYGINVRIINNIDSEWDWFKEAYETSEEPPLVGISSTFYLSWKEVGRLAKRLRDVDNNMEIILGGAFANSLTVSGGSPADFEAPMRKYGISHTLHAFNSEVDLRDLILARKAGTAVDTVSNLCTLGRDKSYTMTQSKWHTPVLAEMPPTWDRLEMPFIDHTFQIRTASGCPFSCAFCSYPTTAGAWKTVDADVVRAHLDSVMRIPGVKNIVFIDDTFNVPPHRFRELLKVFAEYPFEWFSFLRVQYADEEVIKMMKDSGCKGVYLGIESASDAVLTNMNKKARKADFAKGVNLLNKYDIDYLAAFVLGFPGETQDTIQENVDFIKDNGVRYYSLKEFYYMPHTEVHEKRDQYGLTGMGAKWSHDTMSYQEATQIKLDMFQSIDESTHVDPDTSLWHMAYLHDKGHTFPEIRQLQEEINDLMKEQLASISPPTESVTVPFSSAGQHILEADAVPAAE